MESRKLDENTINLYLLDVAFCRYLTFKELVDFYGAGYNIIGKVDRGEAHKTGKLHKTVQCWIIDSDFIYFQIRGNDSDFAELLDVTAGGHIGSGETEEKALIRESSEEIGFSPDLNGLNFVERYHFEYRNDAWFVREFSDAYIIRVESGFESLYPSSEIAGIAAVPFVEGKKLLDGRIESLNVDSLRSGPNRNIVNIEINYNSFVPGCQEYFARVLTAAQKIKV